MKFVRPSADAIADPRVSYAASARGMSLFPVPGLDPASGVEVPHPLWSYWRRDDVLHRNVNEVPQPAAGASVV